MVRLDCLLLLKMSLSIAVGFVQYNPLKYQVFFSVPKTSNRNHSWHQKAKFRALEEVPVIIYSEINGRVCFNLFLAADSRLLTPVGC